MVLQTKQFPLWISHTSIKDFLDCPLAYYLRHVYKDPKNGHKINIINPAMALGLTVHDVLEEISVLPCEKRLEVSLIDRFEKSWMHVTGERGGFRDSGQEEVYKKRGLQMMSRVMDHPGLLLNKAVKLHSPDELPPRYMFSSTENIVLCGRIDWIEYLPEDNSIHIVDFKTGTRDEKEDSLQLPIYLLLATNCFTPPKPGGVEEGQRRAIKRISYWYLERENEPLELKLPDYLESEKRIIEIALQIKKMRLEGKYKCIRGGCYSCRPLDLIIQGKGKYIKTSGKMDVYINLQSEK